MPAKNIAIKAESWELIFISKLRLKPTGLILTAKRNLQGCKRIFVISLVFSTARVCIFRWWIDCCHLHMHWGKKEFLLLPLPLERQKAAAGKASCLAWEEVLFLRNLFVIVMWVSDSSSSSRKMHLPLKWFWWLLLLFASKSRLFGGLF